LENSEEKRPNISWGDNIKEHLIEIAGDGLERSGSD
jgi:hypothetical protein